VVAEQQAQQAAQAAYEAANNTENPQWFCAWVTKITFPTDNGSNSPTYIATLTPLVAQDCNVNYWGYSTNAIRQRLLDTIDGDPDLSSNCPNTRSAISNYNFSFGGAVEERFIYKDGRSLLSEVGLSPTDYTVVSPNTYKLFELLIWISLFANDNDLNFDNDNQTETSCKNAIESKLNSIESDKFCLLGINNDSTCPDGKTKVVLAQCAYGSGVPSNYRTCANLKDQF
jgi:hypothetical protein